MWTLLKSVFLLQRMSTKSSGPPRSTFKLTIQGLKGHQRHCIFAVPETPTLLGDPNHPSVLVISFGKDPSYDDVTKHLFEGLKSKAPVYEATTPAEFIFFIARVKLTAIIVTEGNFAQPVFSDIRKKVADYAKEGAIVVFCGCFSSTLDARPLHDMWLSDWNLDWKMGDEYRATFRLNPSRNQKLQTVTSMPSLCSMNALHLVGVPSEAMVYIRTPDWDMSQSPVAFTPIGEGYVGYVGDIDGEEQSTAVVLGMCGLLN